MPNYCYNDLDISGSPEDLRIFKRENHGSDEKLSFEKSVPRPTYANWYTWNVTNWGTKWDAMSVDFTELNEGKINYNFDTAWSPPNSWLAKVAAKYPKLSFHLVSVEPGCDFRWEYKYINGTKLLSRSESITAYYERDYFPKLFKVFSKTFPELLSTPSYLKTIDISEMDDLASIVEKYDDCNIYNDNLPQFWNDYITFVQKQITS